MFNIIIMQLKAESLPPHLLCLPFHVPCETRVNHCYKPAGTVSNDGDDDWSQDEEMVLTLAHSELGGNKWAEICKRLPGKTANNVKNKW